MLKVYKAKHEGMTKSKSTNEVSNDSGRPEAYYLAMQRNTNSGLITYGGKAVQNLRREWYKVFDPSNTHSEQAYETIRENFVSLGKSVAESSHFYKVKPNGDLSAEIRSAPPFRKLLRSGTLIDHQTMYGLKYAPRGENELPSRFYARIMNRPENYLLVSVMVSGFSPGYWMYNLLKSNDKVADFSLMGYSEGSYLHYGDHFSDGTSEILKKVMIPPNESERLKSNAGKPVLIIDDAIVTGNTVRIIANALKEFGFKEIYSMTQSKFYILS